jgi:hypothetical protein
VSTANRRTLGQVTLDDPIDVSVDTPGPLELEHGHRGQLLADEVEELGGVLTGACVDVDDEGAVHAADDGEVADAGPTPANAGRGAADGADAYLPATVFPAGLSSAGLPIGVQAIGSPFTDMTTIELARIASGARA